MELLVLRVPLEILETKVQMEILAILEVMEIQVGLVQQVMAALQATQEMREDLVILVIQEIMV